MSNIIQICVSSIVDLLPIRKGTDPATPFEASNTNFGVGFFAAWAHTQSTKASDATKNLFIVT